MADTLYETIGGTRRINAAVELFYAKVFADDSVRSFFEGVDAQGLHARQSMFVSMLLGGKKVYTGKDLSEAHANSRMKVPEERARQGPHLGTVRSFWNRVSGQNTAKDRPMAFGEIRPRLLQQIEDGIFSERRPSFLEVFGDELLGRLAIGKHGRSGQDVSAALLAGAGTPPVSC